MSIRALVCLCAGLLTVGLAAPLPAAAQFPDRPVKLIATQGAGSSTDLHARLIAIGLAPRLGQPVVVENVAGVAGTLGVTKAVHSPADGYTLVLGNNGNIGIAPFTMRDLPYDPNKDLVPVAHLTDNWQVLVAGPRLGPITLQQFIALAKANPGKFNYGSPGEGSHAHLAMELLQSMAGIKLVHVPYKTTGQITTDLAGGTLDVAFDNYVAVKGLAEQGKLRVLAVTSAGPLASVPNVPPVAQAVPGYEATGWFGVFAPAGTPPAVVQRLNSEINAVLADPKVVQTMQVAGFEAKPSQPAEFAQFVRAAQKKWGDTVKSIGLEAK
jgi:tripartite-type tricarboxylate transporter receptor subunit TctC